MRLVIAEKRSVAFAIAQALGDVRQGDGYVSAGGALISWAQGHLVELSDPEEYTDMPWSAHKWTMESLPIDPKSWRWCLSGAKGAVQRYRSLSELLRSDKVTELVNACDPDREGEAIFRRILMAAKIFKPSLRLWVASLDEQAIRDAWKRMRPESDYDGLADAADARAKADWLVGMNASRAHTLAWHRSLSLGRVRTPTLNMVVQRDLAIESHKPTPFWRLIVPMDGWTLESGKIEDRAMARRILADAMGLPVEILEVRRRREHAKPPTLFDLTGLQKDMSRLHGLTAARTLSALQSLYEKKLATYPRTDSQYITHDDLDTLRGLTEGDRLAAGFIEPDAKPERPHLELTVNDAKVAGHTAILPTMQADKAALDELGDDERLVLTRVVRRMWEAVGDDYVHDVTNVVANIDPHWCEKHPDEGRLLPEGECRFTSRSDQPVSLGWHAIEHAAPQEDHGEEDEAAGNIIPANLAAGVSIAPVPHGGATLSEGKTKPPKPFTEATLLAAMEHASRWVEDKDLKAALDDDESHSGGIGTPATRADVIEKLIRTGYVERKGKQLRSTEQGRSLIDVVAPKLKDVALTAGMERRLSEVEHSQAAASQVETEFRDLAARIPADAQTAVRQDHVQTKTRNAESFGDCPRCGKPVVKTGKVFQCSTNRREKQPDGTWNTTEGCGWRAWTTIAGKTITDMTMRRLLDGRKVSLKGFTSRKGSTFDAALLIDKDKGIAFDFGNNNKERKKK